MEILLYILLGLQVVFALVIIALVLLHSPKGDGLASMGGAGQLFTSPKGAEEGLNQITFWAIGIFFALAFITGFYGHSLIPQA